MKSISALSYTLRSENKDQGITTNIAQRNQSRDCADNYDEWSNVRRKAAQEGGEMKQGQTASAQT